MWSLAACKKLARAKSPYHGGLCKEDTSRPDTPVMQGTGSAATLTELYTLLRVTTSRVNPESATRCGPSAAAVGGVGPGAGQQRHVVVRRGVGNAEVQRHGTQEGGLGQLDAARTQGLVGEQADGFVAVVPGTPASAEVTKLVNEVNARRKARYGQK